MSITHKQDWFFKVFGFTEGNYADTRAFVNQESIHRVLPPPPNAPLCIQRPIAQYNRHKSEQWLTAGHFETPSVGELRKKLLDALEQLKRAGLMVSSLPQGQGTALVSVQNMVGESGGLHLQPDLTGAVFQAASQFNCLEFSTSSGRPEDGVTCYHTDKTQGPACALATAAGLLFRQYSVRVHGKDTVGQTSSFQLNNLWQVEEYLGTTMKEPVPWTVSNGYIEGDQARFDGWNAKWAALPSDVKAKAISRMRVGVQWDTQVTLPDAIIEPEPLLVTHVYVSAVSVGYSKLEAATWRNVACLVLEASYEATLLVALLNNVGRLLQGKSQRPVLLTKLGGGVFQNEDTWIQGAISKAVSAVQGYGLPLECWIVHYKKIEDGYDDFVKSLSS